MLPSPYRSPAPDKGREEPAPPLAPECEGPLRALILALWVASLVRAGAAFAHHETIGSEPTLAIVVVFLLPWLFREAFRAQ